MPSREPVTHLDLDADLSTVWSTLTNFERYPEWNPYVALRGDLREGAWIRMSLRCGRLRGVVPVKLVEVAPKRALAWRGGIGGIVTGTHYFRLEPREGGGTHLLHGERLEGRLVGLAWRLLEDDLLHLYASINRALKRAVDRA